VLTDDPAKINKSKLLEVIKNYVYLD